LLERGRERFDIYCAVCHGRTGDGNGIIVRRGFRRPPSYHTDRLRNAPAGHFYDVISNGFGAMASYANRIDVADRWAILAYIRALQLSQNARLDDVHEDQREDLPPLDEAAAAGGRADSDLQRTLHAVPRAHYGVPDKEYCVPVGVERAVVAQRCAVAAGRPFPAVTLDPEAATCAIQPAQVPREDAP
ncbi:MAG: c-type cytochrome, partial [Deltaproteobacteria bacterium]